MAEAKWGKILVVALTCAGLSWGQQPVPMNSIIVENGQQILTVPELGKDRQAQVLKSWRQPDGKVFYEVQSLDTGERMIVAKSPIQATQPVISVPELGKDKKAQVLKSWHTRDGKAFYEVQVLDSGEHVILVDQGQPGAEGMPVDDGGRHGLRSVFRRNAPAEQGEMVGAPMYGGNVSQPEQPIIIMPELGKDRQVKLFKTWQEDGKIYSEVETLDTHEHMVVINGGPEASPTGLVVDNLNPKGKNTVFRWNRPTPDMPAGTMPGELMPPPAGPTVANGPATNSGPMLPAARTQLPPAGTTPQATGSTVMTGNGPVLAPGTTARPTQPIVSVNGQATNQTSGAMTPATTSSMPAMTSGTGTRGNQYLNSVPTIINGPGAPAQATPVSGAPPSAQKITVINTPVPETKRHLFHWGKEAPEERPVVKTLPPAAPLAPAQSKTTIPVAPSATATTAPGTTNVAARPVPGVTPAPVSSSLPGFGPSPSTKANLPAQSVMSPPAQNPAAITAAPPAAKAPAGVTGGSGEPARPAPVPGAPAQGQQITVVETPAPQKKRHRLFHWGKDPQAEAVISTPKPATPIASTPDKGPATGPVAPKSTDTKPQPMSQWTQVPTASPNGYLPVPQGTSAKPGDSTASAPAGRPVTTNAAAPAPSGMSPPAPNAAGIAAAQPAAAAPAPMWSPAAQPATKAATGTPTTAINPPASPVMATGQAPAVAGATPNTAHAASSATPSAWSLPPENSTGAAATQPKPVAANASTPWSASTLLSGGTTPAASTAAPGTATVPAAPAKPATGTPPASAGMLPSQPVAVSAPAASSTALPARYDGDPRYTPLNKAEAKSSLGVENPFSPLTPQPAVTPGAKPYADSAWDFARQPGGSQITVETSGASGLQGEPKQLPVPAAATIPAQASPKASEGAPSASKDDKTTKRNGMLEYLREHRAKEQAAAVAATLPAKPEAADVTAGKKTSDPQGPDPAAKAAAAEKPAAKNTPAEKVLPPALPAASNQAARKPSGERPTGILAKFFGASESAKSASAPGKKSPAPESMLGAGTATGREGTGNRPPESMLGAGTAPGREGTGNRPPLGAGSVLSAGARMPNGVVYVPVPMMTMPPVQRPPMAPMPPAPQVPQPPRTPVLPGTEMANNAFMTMPPAPAAAPAPNQTGTANAFTGVPAGGPDGAAGAFESRPQGQGYGPMPPGISPAAYMPMNQGMYPMPYGPMAPRTYPPYAGMPQMVPQYPVYPAYYGQMGQYPGYAPAQYAAMPNQTVMGGVPTQYPAATYGAVPQYPVPASPPMAPVNYNMATPASYAPYGAPRQGVLPASYNNPAAQNQPSVLATPDLPGDEIGRQLMRILHDSLYPSERERAADNLATRDWRTSPQVVDALVKAAAEDPAATVRAACVHGLGQMRVNTVPAVTAIQGLKADPDVRVRNAVDEALANMSPKATK